MSNFTKLGIAICVVLAVAAGYFYLTGTPQVQNLGGETGFSNIINTDFVKYNSYSTTTDAAYKVVVRESIPLGSQRTSWRNDTGGTVYFTSRSLYVDGTATGTFALVTGKSTDSFFYVGSVVDDQPYAFATTSPSGAQVLAGTTKFLIGTSTARVFLNQNQATTTPYAVAVRPGEYLTWQISAVYGCQSNLEGTPPAGAQGKCEAATSTGRGFTLDVWAEGYATTTPAYLRKSN